MDSTTDLKFVKFDVANRLTRTPVELYTVIQYYIYYYYEYLFYLFENEIVLEVHNKAKTYTEKETYKNTITTMLRADV